MGQAKARGSFEQRKAIAIERDKELAKERHEAWLKRQAERTPEEIKREREAEALYYQMVGMSLPYWNIMKHMNRLR